MHLNSAGKERRIGFGKVTAVRDILAVFHSLIRETDEEKSHFLTRQPTSRDLRLTRMWDLSEILCAGPEFVVR